MKSTIERLTHQHIDIRDFGEKDALPLFLKDKYDYQKMNMNGGLFLLATPREQENLTSVRKHKRQLEKATGLPVVFGFQSLGYYTKSKMLEEGIPFVIENSQVYLPSLGVYLNKEPEKRVQAPREISFIAQKFLLEAIYRRWSTITASEVARELGVNRMSISRAFDEIEGKGLSFFVREGRSRSFVCNDTGSLWRSIEPILRSPVKKEYLLAMAINEEDLLYGGMSAISRYTMLADDNYPTYAVERECAKALNLDAQAYVPFGEAPGAVVQVVGYMIPNKEKKSIDPLSAVLSLSREDREDPRVEGAVEDILQEFVYD